MPNHIECCSKPVLNWISKNISDVPVNVMSQYRPEYKASNYEEISQPISQKEFVQIKKYVNDLGLYEI
jgi:putative pyruvate formate lyase activating enzyme